MKKWLVAAAATAVLAVSGMASGQEPMVIKFSHVVAENTPKGQAALKFKEEAEKRLPGRVKVEVYPNSTLFGDARELEALLLGDVHVLSTSLSKFGKFTKTLQIYDLPFLFEDQAALDRFQASREGRALLTSMTSKGFLGLAYWHNGLKQMSANKPLLLPDDAAGLKFRIQPSDLLASQFQALNAVPRKLGFSEVYRALKSGAVDGQENTWSNIDSQKFHHVQKHITETNHGIIDYMVLVNNNWWDGLPPDIRAGLTKAMEAATKTNNEVAEKLNADAKKRVEASGVATIHQIDARQRAAWQKAMAPVWKKYEASIGKDLVAAARKANTASTN